MIYMITIGGFMVAATAYAGYVAMKDWNSDDVEKAMNAKSLGVSAVILVVLGVALGVAL